MCGESGLIQVQLQYMACEKVVCTYPCRSVRTQNLRGEGGDTLGGLESLGARSLVDGAGALGPHGDESVSLAHLEHLVGGDEVEPVDELLCDHAGDGDHGDASVVELLELLVVEPLHILARGELEGVELVVSGGEVILEEEQLVRLERVLPRFLHAVGLDGEDQGPQEPPEGGGHLLEVVDRGAGDVGVEEEAGSLHLLANEETERGEHGDAAVGDLHVSVALSLRLLNVVVETEEVDPISEWRAALDRASLYSRADVGERTVWLGLDIADLRHLFGGEDGEGGAADAGHRVVEEGVVWEEGARVECDLAFCSLPSF
mmetsp:Transcript_29621/g.73994  ORF Transcript_29621/g.73994 Transcript_29621/m.73994 type:complete len:317 (-) Transcript_29621:14-964(-)